MDISLTPVASSFFSQAYDLTSNILNPKYTLKRVHVKANESGLFLSTLSTLTLLVVEGEVSLTRMEENEKVTTLLVREEGMHIFQNSTFQIKASSTDAVLMLASTHIAQLGLNVINTLLPGFRGIPLDTYQVEKPWGWERWYTQNIATQIPYALKMIFMKEGCKSSLQSHIQKSETNYVIEGTALVLAGKIAPADLKTAINTDELTRTTYGPNTGWSNVVNELHRVIAQTSYKAVEISTPELDDVVRWADDSNRISGRIDSEHLGSVRENLPLSRR